MRRIGAGLAAIAALLGSPAQAGWHQATWGMSVEQVRDATDGAATENADRRFDSQVTSARLRMPFSASGFATTAYFGFDQADRLQVVSLIPDDPASCQGLLTQLHDVYGAVARPDTGGIMSVSWRDLHGGNLVEFTFIPPDYCQVEYRALPRPGVDGSL